MPVTFSVAIPNFNYAQFIAATVRSVFSQGDPAVEVYVSDNASTDESLAILGDLAYPRLRWHRNNCNVGFARNIDRAVAPTIGSHVIVLSSDDVMLPGALAAYRTLLEQFGSSQDRVIVSVSCVTIDRVGCTGTRNGPTGYVWRQADIDPELSEVTGMTVLSARSEDILRRSLATLKNPVPFLATMFPRSAYDALEGYGGSRLINPDKWFHWRLLEVTDRVVFVDHELFGFRVHNANQTAQQARARVLKFHVDEYAMTLEVSDEMLARADMNRAELIQAFLVRDIVERGFALVAAGDSHQARRLVHFARATYPREALREPRVAALSLAARLGAVSGPIARRFQARFRHRVGAVKEDLLLR